MIKQTLLTLVLFCSFLGIAQKHPTQLKYARMVDGEPASNTRDILVYQGVCQLGESRNGQSSFIDYNKGELVSFLQENDQLFKTVESFADLPQPESNERTSEKILGYTAYKATAVAFSNTIEVWYTTEAGFSGTMYSRTAPAKNALVLRVRINGGTTYELQAIEKKDKEAVFEYEYDRAVTIGTDVMEEKKIESRYTTIPVFENEVVNFEPNLPIDKSKQLQANKTYRFSKGSVIMKKIKLDEDLLYNHQVFATLHCRSDGDAYDRTGSVFVIPADTEKTTMLDAFQNGLEQLPVTKDSAGKNYQGITSTEAYDAPIEIMRFFTSFGADHFNDKRVINNYPWAKDVRYKQEVTSVFPQTDSIWVGVFIGNYAKNGHRVSLELNFYPGGRRGDRQVKKIVEPLFLTVNTMEMSGQNYGRFFRTDDLTVKFTVPEKAKNLHLYFTTTGHGGWGGGDEFNPKLNQVLVDDDQVFEVIPWRTDCATYRFSNPASGNFGNGLSSSDLSRSNWCPGTLTPPYIIPLEGLTPGEHSITVKIDQGEDTENGFHHWGVSGVLTGEME